MKHIKKNRKTLYFNLLTNGKLTDHLSELDNQAEEIFSLLVKQMAAIDYVVVYSIYKRLTTDYIIKT